MKKNEKTFEPKVVSKEVKERKYLGFFAVINSYQMQSRTVETYSYEWPIGTPVVAIDIGTSGTLLSLTYVGNEMISQELLCPAVASVSASSESSQQTKTPSVCLLRPHDTSLDASILQNFQSPDDVELIAFGREAETLYCGMDNVERLSYIFCQHFKMALLLGENSAPNPVVPLNQSVGFTVNLSVVFAKCLEVCKMTALEHLKNTHKSDTNAADVVWILSVPAIYR
jgi:hypothetical protein